ncbi:PTS sugar transporter subunit IIB [Xenorhabdus szentirmaii]|uniref:PTS sugar transporter subunit IIB n=1 Tax=Xenorhabdus szentirmaii TaxID=290112 RepID=UPI0019B893C6|nr:PTS sugar transporter subunit IIB [Xenorhabdus sp. 38]MBD2780949.1 PTS sugar transporter subunit IIB [Xenorhabdus sp. 38]
MKTILLCCAAGMSTSMLATNMSSEAGKKGMEVVVKAIPIQELEAGLGEADVVLLGPQVHYELKRITALAEPLGKPVGVIDRMDYGALRGDKILEHALGLLKK